MARERVSPTEVIVPEQSTNIKIDQDVPSYTQLLVQYAQSQDESILTAIISTCRQNYAAIDRSISALPTSSLMSLFDGLSARLNASISTRGSLLGARRRVTSNITSRAAGAIPWLRALLTIHSGFFIAAISSSQSTGNVVRSKLAALRTIIQERTEAVETVANVSSRLDCILRQISMKRKLSSVATEEAEQEDDTVATWIDSAEQTARVAASDPFRVVPIYERDDQESSSTSEDDEDFEEEDEDEEDESDQSQESR